MIKEIENELNKALGNLSVEGIDVSEEEYKNILRILKKYKEENGEEALESLLYSLAIGHEQDKNGKQK